MSLVYAPMLGAPSGPPCPTPLRYCSLVSFLRLFLRFSAPPGVCLGKTLNHLLSAFFPRPIHISQARLLDRALRGCAPYLLIHISLGHLGQQERRISHCINSFPLLTALPFGPAARGKCVAASVSGPSSVGQGVSPARGVRARTPQTNQYFTFFPRPPSLRLLSATNQ